MVKKVNAYMHELKYERLFCFNRNQRKHLRKINLLVQHTTTNTISKLCQKFRRRRQLILRRFVSVAPEVSIRPGRSLDLRNVRESSDVYFECEISANPAVYKIAWFHQVSCVIVLAQVNEKLS